MVEHRIFPLERLPAHKKIGNDRRVTLPGIGNEKYPLGNRKTVVARVLRPYVDSLRVSAGNYSDVLFLFKVAPFLRDSRRKLSGNTFDQPASRPERERNILKIAAVATRGKTPNQLIRADASFRI